MNYIKRGIRKLRSLNNTASSDSYAIVEDSHTFSMPNSAWLDAKVAKRQDTAYQPLLKEMHQGNPRADLLVLAEAIGATRLFKPSLLEVGCGSGYYSEVLDFLLNSKTNYTGVDFSAAMIKLAKKKYSKRPFFVADALVLPFKNRAFDIVINGTALMHILDYGRAIYESKRVAKSWCIFHTVPILQQRQTTLLQKRAYGEMTFEVIFNEAALMALFKQSGLQVEHRFESIAYNLTEILQEETTTKTYVCSVKEIDLD